MKLATLTLLTAAALSFTAGPVQSAPRLSGNAVALITPVPEQPERDASFPERDIDPTWNDTANTTENLDVLDPIQPGVHLETDLNNDVSDPLLEEPAVRPVEDLSPERDLIPGQPPYRDPFRDPLP